ncbi:hypothetical protein BGX28_003957 [Mortierella sp. GBA30]|nr:hypothetical protein BGX28_003957 [Mortierella sp. GBA30]
MVHPGIIVAGVFGVVLTGVVIYEIFKEELNDFFESFEKPSPVGYGFERLQDQGQEGGQRQRGFAEDENDHFERGQSSSFYQADYELRQRQRHLLRPDDDDENEKDTDNHDDILMERLRKINESEVANAATEARLAEREQAMKEREEKFNRLERELRESNERNARREQEVVVTTHQQHGQTIFASDDHPLHDSERTDVFPPTGMVSIAANSTAAAAVATVVPEVDSRAANAILRHDLSSSHSDRANPFEDPNSLMESSTSSSVRSSYQGDERDTFADADDRSVTVGRDDEDLDWTEAEIGSIGSHESEESWGSP